MQPHAENQQNDADVRELLRQLDVGDEARRGRTDENTREQIADERWQLDARREEAHHECQPEAGDERGEEGDVRRHCRLNAVAATPASRPARATIPRDATADRSTSRAPGTPESRAGSDSAATCSRRSAAADRGCGRLPGHDERRYDARRSQPPPWHVPLAPTARAWLATASQRSSRSRRRW